MVGIATHLAKDLAQAAQKLSDLKANGQNVPDYLNQNQLIDDGLSDGAKPILKMYSIAIKRSAKAISEKHSVLKLTGSRGWAIQDKVHCLVIVQKKSGGIRCHHAKTLIRRLR